MSSLSCRYTYEHPSDPKWAPLLSQWLHAMPTIRSALGGQDYPLIWTADIILDTAPDGKDAYRLGEMNCSCVGFTTELGLVDEVVAVAIGAVQEAAGKHCRLPCCQPPGKYGSSSIH